MKVFEKNCNSEEKRSFTLYNTSSIFGKLTRNEMLEVEMLVNHTPPANALMAIQADSAETWFNKLTTTVKAEVEEIILSCKVESGIKQLLYQRKVQDVTARVKQSVKAKLQLYHQEWKAKFLNMLLNDLSPEDQENLKRSD